jgi:hypothetical protein
MDLMRPPSAVWAESLVATYAADAPEVLRRDFRNSLLLHTEGVCAKPDDHDKPRQLG